VLGIRRDDRLDAHSGGVGTPKAVAVSCNGAVFLLVFQSDGSKGALGIIKLFDLLRPEAAAGPTGNGGRLFLRSKGNDGNLSVHDRKRRYPLKSELEKPPGLPCKRVKYGKGDEYGKGDVGKKVNY